MIHRSNEENSTKESIIFSHSPFQIISNTYSTRVVPQMFDQLRPNKKG